MKCPCCMEEIADNSEKCSLCNSEFVKPCPYCMEKIQADALKCKHCGSMLNPDQPAQTQQVQPPIQQQQFQQNVTLQPLPAGVSGWSWGAALLNWIWAIGNKVWIGLLAIVPGINIVMFFVLGIKGREWAWKSGQWESVDHFNRVQKKWSQWAVGLTLIFGVGGCLAAIAVPQFSAYKTKGNNAAALSGLKNLKTTLESTFADKQMYPDSLEASGFKIPDDVFMKCSMNPVGYVCVSAHKNGTKMYVVDNGNAKIDEQSYITGSPVQVPYYPPMSGSAKADEYFQNQPAGQVQPDVQQQPNGQMTFSPSFDCSKASTGAERMICSNSDLAQADVQLAQAYKAGLSKSADKAAFKKEQGAWIRNQRDACSDAAAMLQVYQDRISQISR